MTKKIKCALIGPGNIGTDLLAKLQRSPVLEPVLPTKQAQPPKLNMHWQGQQGIYQ